ncbi:MAG: helix-turn-helix domain-containing protein, partial [Methylocystis sp.]|nr:helix-turn-helix domain-containing protein [Methylocystis sp.]
MSEQGKRPYASKLRSRSAEVTRTRVLDAAKELFAGQGIDGVTIARIAEKAGVAAATVYSLFKSKEGLLHALMHAALFGPLFQEARARLEGVT